MKNLGDQIKKINETAATGFNQLHINNHMAPRHNAPSFKSQHPYPEIIVNEKNPVYARQIISNIGGETSEMSAVALYFYANLITNLHPKIAEAFHQTSIVEMHHLRIFGQLGIALGADPRLWSRTNFGMRYWNAGLAGYPEKKSVKYVLNAALESELEAIKKYKRQIEIIKNDNIRAILARVIEDEKIHVSIFKRFLSE